MSVNILLADDHLMVREGLKQVLELDHDIDVISEASDGYECLNLINKTHPDVVLLDINMPNLDGLQVLSIMKQQKKKTGSSPWVFPSPTDGLSHRIASCIYSTGC